jgi:hypothetical protein
VVVCDRSYVRVFKQIPMFEWCKVRCDSRNGHPKDTCLKEIGTHALPNLLTILDIIINILGIFLESFDNLKNLHFDNEYNVPRSSENHEGGGLAMVWIC